jgi:hypothetical protein
MIEGVADMCSYLGRDVPSPERELECESDAHETSLSAVM